jgi:hypothetical protein
MVSFKGGIRLLGGGLAACGVLAAGLLFALFGTTWGAKFLTKMSLEHFWDDQDIVIEEISGVVNDQVYYKDIEVRDLPYLPAGAILRIKTASVFFTALNMDGVNARIDQARLFLPFSDPVVIHGEILSGLLSLNIFSNYVSFKDAGSLSLDNVFLRSMEGDIGPVDIFGSGSLSRPRLTGKIFVQKLANRMARMKDSHVRFDLEFPHALSGVPGVSGIVRIHDGTISARKTAEIQLEESVIRFSQETDNPELDIKGRAVVGGVNIKLLCSGTLKQPEITLSSTPPLPEQQLLVMLATGKDWTGTASDLNSGRITTDTAKDFIDYFVLGGTGNQLAKKLGIKDFSVTLEKETQGLGITKSISENIDATYAVEQTKTTPGEEMTKQKVGGEVKVNDKISVGAERQFINELSQPETSSQNPQTQTTDKIFIKYKTNF